MCEDRAAAAPSQLRHRQCVAAIFNYRRPQLRVPVIVSRQSDISRSIELLYRLVTPKMGKQKVLNG